MNLQICFICLLHKGCTTTLDFCLLQQTRMLQHPGFLFAPTDKDASTTRVFACSNRQGCYGTLCRLIACPSATLPPWTDFYQSVIHFLDFVIRNHRDEFFPSTILLINTFMFPTDTSLHHCAISFFDRFSS